MFICQCGAPLVGSGGTGLRCLKCNPLPRAGILAGAMCNSCWPLIRFEEKCSRLEDENASLRERLAALHDKGKCPNCENCIRNLREDKQRLEGQLSQAQERVKRLGAVASLVAEAMDRDDQIIVHNAQRDRAIYQAMCALEECDGK